MSNYIIYKNENAIYYECGYSCDNAIYLKLDKEAFFITDGRYTIDAKDGVKGAKVVTASNLIEELAKYLKKNKVKKISIDPHEWDIASYKALKDIVPTRFKKKPHFSHLKRIIKSQSEIELLSEAVNIGREAFKDISLAILENTHCNEMELNFLAESILRDYGKRDISFEPILAIGKNAAKPHATPTNTPLNSGDLILLDAGVKYKRYCSDRTRTAFFNGENLRFNYKQKFENKAIKKAYDSVLKAHDKAIKKARSGMKASEIDKIARDIIDKAGFGKYFVHSTGHGVGLDIHEMPYISSKSETIIEDGMVFTIEPGIYIEGEFGIRIEDMVVMENSKAKML